MVGRVSDAAVLLVRPGLLSGSGLISLTRVPALESDSWENPVGGSKHLRGQNFWGSTLLGINIFRGVKIVGSKNFWGFKILGFKILWCHVLDGSWWFLWFLLVLDVFLCFFCGF